jgi:hypothetical protein
VFAGISRSTTRIVSIVSISSYSIGTNVIAKRLIAAYNPNFASIRCAKA